GGTEIQAPTSGIKIKKLSFRVADTSVEIRLRMPVDIMTVKPEKRAPARPFAELERTIHGLLAGLRIVISEHRDKFVHAQLASLSVQTAVKPGGVPFHHMR